MAAIEVNTIHETLRIPRKLAVGVALGVAGILSSYVIAGQTASRDPMVMPYEAVQLPWPNGQVRPFLVPRQSAHLARCGDIHTFLGSLYDSTNETTPRFLSVEGYEGNYEAASGTHNPKAEEVRASLAGAAATSLVVYCQTGPKNDVVYLP